MQFLLPLVIGAVMTPPLSPPAPIALSGPTQASADGSPIVLRVHGLGPAPLDDEAWSLDVFPTQAAWLSNPIRWAKADYLLFRSTASGLYQISLYHASDGKLSKARHVVAVGNVSPPDPRPEPTPPVPPQPPTGPRWYVLVYESETDGPLLTELLNDGKIAPALHAFDSFWLPLDKDTVDSSGNPPPAVAAYFDLAAASHPYLIVTAADGSILYQGVCPLTAAAVLDLVPFTRKDTPDAR